MDKEKEITISQTVVIASFSAATICQILMFIFYGTMIYMDEEIIAARLFTNEFFLMDPIFRILFSSAYMSFAAGLLIK